MPEEVIHEAQGYPDIDTFSDLIYPTTAGVLRALQEVMATVDPADSTLVDLFRNRGNADPLLIACAIDARMENAQYLFADEWVVVSDDRAVQSKARELEVAALTSSEFLIELRSRSIRSD
ncbi:MULTISPECIES: hypothetical protein [unclassified Frondihabitans]|uniref:hypothetical protein n=1 Tax=unclassified Frondihabitans TaxID=2626248 RepID=UPI000F506E68|nr:MULTISPECIES: hypothetical protein [unclassified Frondihabitans]